MKIIKPDSADQRIDPGSLTIFLAGSIDNGAAGPWAQTVESSLTDLNVTIYNPRRDKWLPNLVQRASEPIFRKQVEWELARLSSCDIPFFFFEEGSVSPITLQELGYVIALRATNSPISTLPVVTCPEGFWRRGNVEIMCAMHQVKVYDTLEAGIAALRAEIKGYHDVN